MKFIGPKQNATNIILLLDCRDTRNDAFQSVRFLDRYVSAIASVPERGIFVGLYPARSRGV